MDRPTPEGTKVKSFSRGWAIPPPPPLPWNNISSRQSWKPIRRCNTVGDWLSFSKMDGSRGSCQTGLQHRCGDRWVAEKDLSRVAVFGKLQEDRQDKPTILGTSALHSLEILFFTTAKVEIDLDPAREIVLEREINKTRPDLSLSSRRKIPIFWAIWRINRVRRFHFPRYTLTRKSCSIVSYIRSRYVYKGILSPAIRM